HAVSILARRDGRARHSNTGVIELLMTFQSSLGVTAERDWPVCRQRSASARRQFQSSLGVTAERDELRHESGDGGLVSILARRDGRARLTLVGEAGPELVFQSSLG